jgi:tripartite-type tricarboxylate transporter receptor subunit TctC
MRMLRIAGAASIAALALAMPPHQAQAQSKTIKIIVPYTPGSGPDITSRLMSEQISKAHGVNMVVENRPGAGTVIGTEAAARSAPDGTTVVMVANSFVINPAVGRGNYTVDGSFEPVCQLAATPMVLVVQSSSTMKTLKDLVDQAKAGKVVFASGGPASSLHIAIEVLKLAPTVVNQIKAGTLRAIVTTSAAPIADLPGVPTLNSTGLAKHEADIFYGIMAPAKTPPDVLAQLAGWFEAAMKTDEVKPKLASQGLFPAVKCGAAFGKFMKDLTEDYTRVIKDAGIKVK